MDKKETQLQVRLSPELSEKFAEKCKREHRNKSETVRMLVENYLKESK